MPTKHSLQFQAELPEEDFSEIVSGVFRGKGGYRITEANERFGEIIGVELKQMSSGPTRWNCKFVATVTWSSQANVIKALIEIVEENYDHRAIACQQRCVKLLNAIEAKVAKFHALPPKPPADTYGSSSWATIESIIKTGNSETEPHPQRLLLAPHDKSFIAISEEDTYANALVCGPPRVGKSTGIFIPNILERMQTSMIVTEATTRENEVSDIYKKTAGARRAAGHRIYYFNPTDLTSTRINPIDIVLNAQPQRRIVEAQKLASIIMQKLQGGGNWEHWDKAARTLLIAMIMHVAEGHRRCAHFGTIRTLIGAGEVALSHVMKDSPSNKARDEYASFCNLATDKYAKGVMVTVKEHLDAWFTEQCVCLTSKTDFKVSDLQNELFTFYLSVPSTREDLKPLMAIVFNYLLTIAMSNKFVHPLALMLDEFTNFGAIPGITEFLSTARKEKVPVVYGIQDRMQLEKVYGRIDAKIIWNNPATRIFFRTSDLDTAKVISESLGKQTIEKRTSNDRGSVTHREMGRWLLSPDEVQSFDPDSIIVFMPSKERVKLKKFDPSQYEEFAEIAVPLNTEIHINEDIINCAKEEVRQAHEKVKAGGVHPFTSQNTAVPAYQSSVAPPGLRERARKSIDAQRQKRQTETQRAAPNDETPKEQDVARKSTKPQFEPAPEADSDDDW